MASKRSRSVMLWVLGVLASGAVGLVASHALHRKAQPASFTPVATAEKPAADVAIPANSDDTVRQALSALTPRQLFQDWLKHDALLNTLVVTAVNLAEDAPPAQLAFLRPHRRFSTTRTADGVVMSARSAARYDAFANVIASLDEHKVAAAYRALHPLLESAYHGLGYPGRPFDEVATQALQRIVDAPVREQVPLHRAGSLWVYADAQLESLRPVEKQLLRMGARNTRLLQGEAREIADALGLHLHGQPQASQ
jgi:hypothetical protein